MHKHKSNFKAIALQLATIFLAVLFCIIPLPLLLCLLLVSTVWKWVAQALAKAFRSDLTHIYSDAGILYALENVYTKPKVNIVLHSIFEGNVGLEQLRQMFQQRILSRCDAKGNFVYRQLRQTWTQFCGFFFWKWDDCFNIENHVRLYDYTGPNLTLPSPCTEEDLKRVMGALIAQPYNKGKSPWEFLVIKNYEKARGAGSPRTAVTFRIHHAIADGYSILKMILHLFDIQKVEMARPNYPQLPLWQRLFRAVTLPIRIPLHLVKFNLTFKDGPHVWHPQKKLSRKYVTFHSDRIPTEKIKAIKNKYGTGYNAAVYSITAGAISRLMKAAGQKPPKDMSVLVPFPLPNHPGGLTNHASAVFFKFSPRIESAHEQIQEIIQVLKSVQSAPVTPMLVRISNMAMAALPVPLLRTIQSRVISVTMCLTSFPGPDRPIKVADGFTLIDIISAIGNPCGAMGVVGSLVSMAGYQRINLTIDRTIFEGYKVPANFNQLVDMEVNELLFNEQDV